MPPLPSPQQLRYLTALAQHRHFGRAAAACAVSQSTLSAGLAALEQQLDADILDRAAGRPSGRAVVFTALGEELVGRAQTALAALAALTEAAESARAPLSGPLRLGVIPTIGPFLLPRLMPALRATFPKLRLYLREDVTERLLDRLNAGRLDLVLLALPSECAGATTLAIMQDEFLAALPPGHPLGSLEKVSSAALEGETLLLMEDGHCLRHQVLEACATLRARGAEGFAATSLHTLAQMVAGNLGVTLLPRLAIDASLTENTGITLRPLEGAGVWRTIALAWRPHDPRAGDYQKLAMLVAGAGGGNSPTRIAVVE